MESQQRILIGLITNPSHETTFRNLERMVLPMTK